MDIWFSFGKKDNNKKKVFLKDDKNTLDAFSCHECAMKHLLFVILCFGNTYNFFCHSCFFPILFNLETMVHADAGTALAIWFLLQLWFARKFRMKLIGWRDKQSRFLLFQSILVYTLQMVGYSLTIVAGRPGETCRQRLLETFFLLSSLSDPLLAPLLLSVLHFVCSLYLFTALITVSIQ